MRDLLSSLLDATSENPSSPKSLEEIDTSTQDKAAVSYSQQSDNKENDLDIYEEDYYWIKPLRIYFFLSNSNVIFLAYQIILRHARKTVIALNFACWRLPAKNFTDLAP